MTYADNGTSVRRNLAFLTPAERKVFEFDEATLLAIDKADNALKASGCMHPLSYRFLLQEQANRGGQ